MTRLVIQFMTQKGWINDYYCYYYYYYYYYYYLNKGVTLPYHYATPRHGASSNGFYPNLAGFSLPNFALNALLVVLIFTRTPRQNSGFKHETPSFTYPSPLPPPSTILGWLQRLKNTSPIVQVGTTYQKRHPNKHVISQLVPKQLWEAQAVGSDNI